MLEKSNVVSAYKPDRRSRVVLQEPEYKVRKYDLVLRSHVARVSPTLLILPQEPEPEADETCMSETSADDESVAGGRSRASSRAGK